MHSPHSSYTPPLPPPLHPHRSTHLDLDRRLILLQLQELLARLQTPRCRLDLDGSLASPLELLALEEASSVLLNDSGCTLLAEVSKLLASRVA